MYSINTQEEQSTCVDGGEPLEAEMIPCQVLYSGNDTGNKPIFLFTI